MKRRKLSSFLLAPLLLCTSVTGCKPSGGEKVVIEPQFLSQNLARGAVVIAQSLKDEEKPDAENLLAPDDSVWTPQDLDRDPAEGQPDTCNTAVEIQLASVCTFNTAYIKEVGNEVQYFHLQAWVDGAWQTVYQSEKIQSMRLCSFDAVTTDRVRLSIDKFRSSKTAAQIQALELYNEPKRAAETFNVTVYQRLDGDVPSEVLQRSPEEIAAFARYYDVYNTVLLFGAIGWEEGKMTFAFPDGEAGFARELAALREIIARRSNPRHAVKIICTTLADGAGGDGQRGVNPFMAAHWESVADQMLEFLQKYDLDGLDIDWEYPVTKEDWQCFDNFIIRLDDGMQAIKPGAILSGALSAWALRMKTEVLQRFDQIQFMAYDGCDQDGYQSSLEQAQSGLADFVKNGADLSKINIGIAAYGRPVSNAHYWADWRSHTGRNLYWDNLHYNVECGGQIFDSTFCAPALAGDKTAYALFSGAGGVMVFRLACDKIMDDPNAVACGIENALKRHVEGF